MRIGGYVMPAGPSAQRLVNRSPRAALEPALTGVVGHVRRGHPGDEPVTLDWTAMDASPAIQIVRATAELNAAGDTVTGTQRLAYRIPVAAFQAVSAARIWLSRAGGVTGHLTVEVWSADGVTGLPDAKLGTIGYVECADIAVAPAYGAHEVYADAAYPCDPATTPGAWLVLAAQAVAGGNVTWGGTATAAAPPTEHAKYALGAWTGYRGELSATVWQGGELCVLRGLLAAGGGGQEYELDIEDGNLYTAVLFDLAADIVVMPSRRGGGATVAPASRGVAEQVSLTIAIVAELGG